MHIRSAVGGVKKKIRINKKRDDCVARAQLKTEIALRRNESYRNRSRRHRFLPRGVSRCTREQNGMRHICYYVTFSRFRPRTVCRTETFDYDNTIRCCIHYVYASRVRLILNYLTRRCLEWIPFGIRNFTNKRVTIRGGKKKTRDYFRTNGIFSATGLPHTPYYVMRIPRFCACNRNRGKSRNARRYDGSSLPRKDVHALCCIATMCSLEEYHGGRFGR